MRVRNKQTREEGFIRSYTWEQGRKLPVFVNGELVLWKRELVEIIHDRPKIVHKIRKIHKDPFEHYTENELDKMWESMSGKAMFVDFIKSIISYFQGTINLVKRHRKGHLSSGVST